MRLTTKGRYAVTAMLDIALHRDKGPVSVVDIAARQGISAAYLEQLVRKLKRAGLLRSSRGPGGGYQFDVEISKVSISDVILAVGEGVDATRCHGSADCQDGVKCLTHDLWAELSHEIDGFLAGITLESLIKQRDVQNIAHRQDDLIQARLL